MAESRRPPQKTALGSSGTRLSKGVASVKNAMSQTRATGTARGGQDRARRPGILSSELAPNWTRIRDGRMIMPRARRPSYRHRHLPLYGRRELDEASALSSAPRRTRRRSPSIGASSARRAVRSGSRGRHTGRRLLLCLSHCLGSGGGGAGDDRRPCRGPNPAAHRSPHGDTACHRRGLRGRRRPLRREGRRLRSRWPDRALAGDR